MEMCCSLGRVWKAKEKKIISEKNDNSEQKLNFKLFSFQSIKNNYQKNSFHIRDKHICDFFFLLKPQQINLGH